MDIKPLEQAIYLLNSPVYEMIYIYSLSSATGERTCPLKILELKVAYTVEALALDAPANRLCSGPYLTAPVWAPIQVHLIRVHLEDGRGLCRLYPQSFIGSRPHALELALLRSVI